ncbi:hypothetical protein [Arthrobacter sp. zg-Y895]|uniref:hypothetical protein n=1 Tax=Arthrobacter sp. zg-Y895 TaxID=2886933 RepID=UPI001D1384A8|nr:hypothetical protein [Arthrobacter sp. zg-Y895]MCC3301250.1 hypothetical protein [Arthrobacter sp. zg-Y895]MCC3302497.1 hypothetical protein [Arthrobacter sp. zg-Y895]
MGDHRNMLLDLTVDEARAEEHVVHVRDWFRRTGWSKADPEAYDESYEMYPADSFGERSATLFAGNGVYSFVPLHGIYTGGGDSYGPRCRECGTEYDLDEAVQLAIAWSDSHVEPVLSCTSCSRQEPMGDWEILSSLTVASFAVIIDVHDRSLDPDRLIAALREELRSQLGGRWVHMVENM